MHTHTAAQSLWESLFDTPVILNYCSMSDLHWGSNIYKTITSNLSLTKNIHKLGEKHKAFS